eukprot:scaffold190350_cov25-Prasinocladus_malaysianus.AAC.1
MPYTVGYIGKQHENFISSSAPPEGARSAILAHVRHDMFSLLLIGILGTIRCGYSLLHVFNLDSLLCSIVQLIVLMCCPYDAPQMYYQPEMLLNSNGFDLGQRQDGTVLGDVALPPWADGSPDEFVRIMREALESEHVSNHLHEWIDLVFGFRQRGKAAEEAVN